MNPEFWHSKWAKNEIGFHLSNVHPLVVKYLNDEALSDISSVFVPLCGKSLDVGYFLQKGKKVIANELSAEAVNALFQSLSLTPNITTWSGGQCYQADNLTVWVGDFFQLTAQQVSDIDLVYDRAALVALPQEMRTRYTAHMLTLTPNAQQLLLTLGYQQSDMAGPPFSVSEEEVQGHYGSAKKITLLSSKEIIEHEPKFAQIGLKSLKESAFWIA